MEKKATNVEFDYIRTLVELDTNTNRIICTKTFLKDGETIYKDEQSFDLCVVSFSVAMQMACAFVQCSSLTSYE